MSDPDTSVQPSDVELVELARSGDTEAFAELWRRHYQPAIRAARQFTTIDADDLVSEAYARIYQRVLAGGGPTGAFRPYLYATIRNLARSWGSADRDVNVDLIEDFSDDRIPDDPAVWALDRSLTARAFRTLPERWQTVLWYTEIEGMDPHEVAPIIGLTANGVAALSYRAREGLRAAWLQAHVSQEGTSPECAWALDHLGSHARNSLGRRESLRLEEHLRACPKCAIAFEEVDEVGSHLAMVLIPMILGGVAGGALLSQLAQPGAAMAATASATPVMPAAVTSAVPASFAGNVAVAGAVAAPAFTAAVGSVGALAGVGSLLGAAAAVAVIAGTVVVGVSDPQAAGPIVEPPAITRPSSDSPAADDDTASSPDPADIPQEPVDTVPVPINDVPINDAPVNDVPVNDVAPDVPTPAPAPVAPAPVAPTPPAQVPGTDISTPPILPPVEEPPVEEPPAEEPPVEEPPVEEPPVEEPPVEEPPVEEPPVEEPPVEEPPVEEPPAEEPPVEEPPAEEPPVVDPPVEEPPVDNPAPEFADVSVDGRGAPGARVTAIVQGAVFASTTVRSDGTWSLSVLRVPMAAGTITLIYDGPSAAEGQPFSVDHASPNAVISR